MLSPDDLTKITDHGTCLDGEGVYYVSDSRPGHWRLTLRGVSFYKHALQHFGLEWPLLTVLSDEQLWALSSQLLRARTVELGLELARELENGRVPARERLLVKAVLHDNPQQALHAAEHHCTTARQGPNIVPGPFGAPPLAVGPHQDFVDGSNWATFPRNDRPGERGCWSPRRGEREGAPALRENTVALLNARGPAR